MPAPAGRIPCPSSERPRRPPSTGRSFPLLPALASVLSGRNFSIISLVQVPPRGLRLLHGYHPPRHRPARVAPTSASRPYTTSRRPPRRYSSRNFRVLPGGNLAPVVSRHVDTAPTSLELTSAAHALVGVLRKVHTVPGRCVAWPNRSALSAAAAAAASSPRRQYGAPSPRHGLRHRGRQSRSNDGHSVSSHS